MAHLGIDKLKAGVLLAVAFFNQGKESAKDGVQAKDIFDFIDEAMQVQGVLATGAEMKAELDDMDMTERADLIATVKEKLNVDDVKAENLVGLGIDLLSVIYAGVVELRTVAS